MARKNYQIKEQPLITGEKPEEKRGYIRDYITGDWIPATPENKEAKVVFEERLVKEYDYSKSQMLPEFWITHGATRIGPADIVVFWDGRDKSQDNIYIIVECKRKDRRDGIQQLKSYLAPCKSAKYGVWFNGKEIYYLQKLEKPPHYKEIPNIPKKGEVLGLPRKADLKPATDLMSIFKTIHNHIYATEGLNPAQAFDEMVKLLFLKIFDEKDISSSIAKFGITEEEYDQILMGQENEFVERINQILESVKKNPRYSKLFPPEEKIKLRPPALGFTVGQLQFLNLTQSSPDIKGMAYEIFVREHYRGDRGQFFTPAPVVDMAVKMLNPQPKENILDPACGTGRFLVSAMKYVWRDLEEKIKDFRELRDAQLSYALDNIRGIDINPDLARVAKLRMVLEEDGYMGIFQCDSLSDFGIIERRGQETGATGVTKGNFDIVLTNPPFGTKGRVESREILEHFELGFKWKQDKKTKKWQRTNNLLEKQVPDILFIERCFEFLNEGGRMAIVLPDGDLTNSSLGYVREWVRDNARILAIVSLPQETFVPWGSGVKASVLFLQKLQLKELEVLKAKDYSIFMGIIEKIGYDIRGRAVYKRDERGEIIVDKKGEKIIDEDVSKVIEEFKKFKEKYKLEF